MKLNALIVKILGYFVALWTAMLQLYEHCYPRVPLVFPTPNLLSTKDMEPIPKATNIRVTRSRNAPFVAGGLLAAFGRPNGTLRTDIIWLPLVHTRILHDSKIHNPATAPRHLTPRRPRFFPAILDRHVQPSGSGSKRHAPPESHHQHGRPVGLHLPQEVTAASPR